VALYARVSTDTQETENQLLELRDFCAKRGDTLIREYVDEAVSGKALRKPQLDDLLRDAHRRDFDTIIFWSLDRLTREGPDSACDILGRIAATGCGFVSYREPALNTLGPWSRIVVDLLAIVASFEAKRISDRTKAGLATARQKGKRLGRPKRDYGVSPDAVRSLRREGRSWSHIERQTGVPATSLRRLAKNVSQENGG